MAADFTPGASFFQLSVIPFVGALIERPWKSGFCFFRRKKKSEKAGPQIYPNRGDLNAKAYFRGPETHIFARCRALKSQPMQKRMARGV